MFPQITLTGGRYVPLDYTYRGGGGVAGAVAMYIGANAVLSIDKGMFPQITLTGGRYVPLDYTYRGEVCFLRLHLQGGGMFP